MICEYFKVSDTNESVLDLHEILKAEFDKDNVQSFDTRQDETITAMKNQHDEKNLEKLVCVSFNSQNS